MKTRELIKILNENGFNLIRCNKHLIFSDGLTKISVPNHGGNDINRHLLAGLLKQIKQAKEKRQ